MHAVSKCSLIAGCRAEAATQGNTEVLLSVAISYGARQDIASAARQIAMLAVEGSLDPHSIDVHTFGEFLSTAAVISAVGAPDLMVSPALPGE
jgi:undecaprenyl diphosphate synthase